MEGLRPAWTVKAIVVVIFASILFRCVSATNHTVGGSSGWDFNSNLRVWSSSIIFRVGDTLVFKYGPMHDVLEVNRADFLMCRTINPIITHNDGSTVVPLTESGTRYFICGRRGHCTMGLRLRVPVLAALDQSAPAPAPAPSNSDSSTNGSSSSPQQPGRRSPRRPRTTPPPPRSDSHSPPPPSVEHKGPEPHDVPPAGDLPPQPSRSGSSSSVGDGSFMIMMLMIIGGLVFSSLTFRSQMIFA